MSTAFCTSSLFYESCTSTYIDLPAAILRPFVPALDAVHLTTSSVDARRLTSCVIHLQTLYRYHKPLRTAVSNVHQQMHAVGLQTVYSFDNPCKEYPT
jgi:hypothetical protein